MMNNVLYTTYKAPLRFLDLERMLQWVGSPNGCLGSFYRYIKSGAKEVFEHLPVDKVGYVEPLARSNVLIFSIHDPKVWEFCKPSVSVSTYNHLCLRLSWLVRKDPFRVVVVPYDFPRNHSGRHFEFYIPYNQPNFTQIIQTWSNRMTERQCPLHIQAKYLKHMCNSKHMHPGLKEAAQESDIMQELVRRAKKACLI